jgi:hypothetical protein
VPTEVLLAALLLLVALTFWRPLRRVRSLLGVSHLLSTGHAFLVLGFLLGLAGGEWPMRVIEEISPVVAFVAGWIGFATGMRFDLRVLRTVPLRAYAVALLPALAAALVVGGATFWGLHGTWVFRSSRPWRRRSWWGVPPPAAVPPSPRSCGGAGRGGPPTCAVCSA